VIVVPFSLKLFWKKEAERIMSNPRIEVLSEISPSWRPNGEIFITTYEDIIIWINKLKAINPQIIILDEIHYIRDKSANQTKAVQKLSKNVPNIICLTGISIAARPLEGFNAIKLNIDELQKYYTKPKEEVDWLGQREGISTKNSHINEFYNNLTETIMIRRLKKDVLNDLPQKIYSFIPLEMDNIKEYNTEEMAYISSLKKESEFDLNNKINQHDNTQIEKLILLTSKGKLRQTSEWIKNFLEVGNKLVVFTSYQFVVDTLELVFPQISVKLDGSVSSAEQLIIANDFENNKSLRLLIGDLRSLDEGIKLSKISYVAFYELPGFLSDQVITTSILKRIGHNEKINIYFLFAAGSIEDKMARLFEKNLTIDNSSVNRFDIDAYSLLRETKNEYRANNR
jgi:SWI/SNF-related matrix-associated actin-dependent regulator 1 of chromatin subfamily A